jgi:hypothetical protein
MFQSARMPTSMPDAERACQALMFTLDLLDE